MSFSVNYEYAMTKIAFSKKIAFAKIL